MNTYYKYISLVAKVIVTVNVIVWLSACSSDDDFTPGPAAPANNVGAYVVNDYNSQNIYEVQPLTQTLSFTVARTKDFDKVVSIPLIFDDIDITKINIPKTADFQPGDTTIKLNVTFPDVEYAKDYNIKFHLDENYCNPYAKVDGSPSVNTSVMWSGWKVMADSMRIIGSYVITNYQGSQLLNFQGQNRFRITNFLNSGIPFEFSIDGTFDMDNPTNSYGKINALSHAYDGGSYWAWGLDDWASWTPVGMTKSINSVYFYPSYGYDNIDLRILSPKDYTFGGKTFTGENDFSSYYRNVELCAIGGAWEYIYFYFYYAKK